MIEPEDLGVTVESRVRIPCTAEGRPETRIKWLREVRSGDFRPVETMPGIRNINGTLTFTRVNKEHGGVYVCQATNDVGPPISKRIQLSVNGSSPAFPIYNLSDSFISELETVTSYV